MPKPLRPLSPLKPLKPGAWDYSKAAHLLNRAGFGGTPEAIDALHRLGLNGAVDRLLDAPDDSAQFPPPEWAVPRNLVAIRQAERLLGESTAREARVAARKKERAQLPELVGWWIDRMRTTPNPLREKLTLFWHGHFATSAKKVLDTYYLWLQNETLRRNALGNFGAMAKAMLRDPAMLLWLDTDASLAFRPNENFARELMELFTLGIGHYTEADVQEAARAFTGYKINPASQTARFAPLQHDDGEKTILRHTGRFDGDDVIDILLRQPACASFISRKLWVFFAYENPSPETVAALADEFRENRYALRPLLRTLFLSREFYSERAVRKQIKSPVQWLVGGAKILGTDLPADRVINSILDELGQVPFVPPNVKGWDGGKSWITTSTLLARYNLSQALIVNQPHLQRRIVLEQKQKEPGAKEGAALAQKLDQRKEKFLPEIVKKIPNDLRKDPQALVARLTLWLFQSPLTDRETAPFIAFLKDKPVTDKTVMDLLGLMMSTPQFQLT